MLIQVTLVVKSINIFLHPEKEIVLNALEKYFRVKVWSNRSLVGQSSRRRTRRPSWATAVLIAAANRLASNSKRWRHRQPEVLALVITRRRQTITTSTTTTAVVILGVCTTARPICGAPPCRPGQPSSRRPPPEGNLTCSVSLGVKDRTLNCQKWARCAPGRQQQQHNKQQRHLPSSNSASWTRPLTDAPPIYRPAFNTKIKRQLAVLRASTALAAQQPASRHRPVVWPIWAVDLAAPSPASQLRPIRPRRFVSRRRTGHRPVRHAPPVSYSPPPLFFVFFYHTKWLIKCSFPYSTHNVWWRSLIFQNYSPRWT